MGRRLLILGHHYQQDEVIALSDLRGDSYQLSDGRGRRRVPGDRLLRRTLHGRNGRHPRQSPRASPAPRRRARDRGPARPEGRLLDGRHGRRRAGGRLLGAIGRSDRRGGGHAGHLRELGGQPQGLLRPARRDRLHVVQRPGRVGLVVSAAAAGALLPRSAPRPQHGLEDGHSAGHDARLDPRQANWAATPAPR